MPTEAVATANLISYMDELFDGVNASTPDLRRGLVNVYLTKGIFSYALINRSVSEDK